jgi:hypothetical protein
MAGIPSRSRPPAALAAKVFSAPQREPRHAGRFDYQVDMLLRPFVSQPSREMPAENHA